jgi:kynurenine formamidase
MPERPVPTKQAYLDFLTKQSNWGRWGADDQKGAINLIDAAKRLRAVSLVKNGRVVSLCRELPKTPAANNPTPAQHFMKLNQRGPHGSVTDFYGTAYHGQSTTHLDALTHVYLDGNLYNGKNVHDAIGFDGTDWGSVTAWSDGIITRGVLFDVPKFRSEAFVTQDRPVQGWELEDIAKAQGIELEPGDAICVYSGREAYNRAGNVWGEPPNRPGLHGSVIPYFKEKDVSVLVWDMMDAAPNDYDLPWQVHPAIPALGIALVDNALLEPLSAACAEEARYDFMLTLAPLIVQGGTGSPLNPLAMF